jgi:hypothetical protein
MPAREKSGGERDVDQLHTLVGGGLVDPLLQVLRYRPGESLREVLNCGDQLVHLPGGAGVLAQAVAEAKLIQPFVHLGQRVGE